MACSDRFIGFVNKFPEKISSHQSSCHQSNGFRGLIDSESGQRLLLRTHFIYGLLQVLDRSLHSALNIEPWFTAGLLEFPKHVFRALLLLPQVFSPFIKFDFAFAPISSIFSLNSSILNPRGARRDSIPSS